MTFSFPSASYSHPGDNSDLFYTTLSIVCKACVPYTGVLQIPSGKCALSFACLSDAFIRHLGAGTMCTLRCSQAGSAPGFF